MDECVACLTKPVVGSARLLRIPRAIAVTVLVFCIPALPQNTSVVSGLSAGDLLRRVVNSVLKDQDSDHSHWMYRLKACGSGRDEEKVVIQTRAGYNDRMC